MGVNASYSRISPEKFAELECTPKAARKFFSTDKYQNKVSIYKDNLEASGTGLSIEKEWQAIHFLLTGEVAWDDASQTKPPVRNVVMGRTPTKWEATYGYVRFLTPDEVKDVARFLNEMPKEILKANFDARGKTEIYTQEDEWDEDDDWDFFMSAYAHLAKFYNQAADSAEIVLLSFD